MKRLESLLLTPCVGLGVLVIGCGGGSDTGGTTPEAKPAASAPSEPGVADAGAAEGKRPARKRRRRRAPKAPQVRGLARVQILAPETKVEGNEVISTIRVRNVSKGSITGFSVSEYWYDDQGNATPGSSRTHRKPFVPGEVLEIELRTTKNSKFYQNQFEFSHANGEVRATVVKSLPKP